MTTNHSILALLPLGGWELGVIALVVIVFLFGKRLPELGRSLGQSITEFKKGLGSGKDSPSIESKDDGPGSQEQRP